MHFGQSVFLFVSAFIAGIINSVAGGGSFLTFPALLFIGIPPIQSNATSTAAVWPGTVASLLAYRKSFTPESRRLLPPLLITGIIGGVLGARILLYTPQATFLKLVPWLLLCATLLFVASGRITLWVRARTSHHMHGDRWLTYGGLFLELFIAMYVGYFGAAGGILMLAVLIRMFQQSLARTNALKNVISGLANAVAGIGFAIFGPVRWAAAVPLAAGFLIGGWAGPWLVRRLPARGLRFSVGICGVALAIRLGVSAYG